MKKHVHVVPHMHWDREWYFTSDESQILLVNNMEEIISMLENNDDYPYYVLDGQTAILEDYLAVKPEAEDRIKKLVQLGKLIIGPWYTQTDEMVVGGESIVRNLLYGRKDSLVFGEPMQIGYLPDSFGQSEKLPQILNGFDIVNCIFWRGSSERKGTDKTEFYWESESEGRVLVQLLPLGYAIGKYLPEEEEALKARMDKYLPVLDRGAVTEHILLPNGHDQMPIQKNIFTILDKLGKLYPDRTFQLSKYEDIFQELEKSDQLKTIRGEMLDGKYMRVHRSIFSSRADLKSSNTRIENKVTNLLEPLASIAYDLGFEYHEGLIEIIWKELLKNHAHDSIGCCCSDKVHKMIENRFFDAEEKADRLIEFYMRKIVDAMESSVSLDKFTAFNFLAYGRDTVIEGTIITKMKSFTLVDKDGNAIPFEIMDQEEVDAGLIDRQIVHYGNYDPFIKYTICLKDTIPALGYKTYSIQKALPESKQECKDRIPVISDNIMENEYYTITIKANGTLEVYDKSSQTMYNNVLLLEDGSDDGDGYDYSPLKEDYLIYSNNVMAEHRIRRFNNKTKAEISYILQVPNDLESRRCKKVDGSMDINLHVELMSGSPIIEIKLLINNQAKDHRVRMLIPNGIGAKFSVSDNQFGRIKRVVRDSAMDVWEEENWDERPDSIYPMLSYAALDIENGLSILTNSVREFEIIGDEYDILAVTIFRSVGYLGKEELFRRPGRPSGIKMETPDSQLLGENFYEFAITSNYENLAVRAKEYLTPILTYNKMPYNAMKLNDSQIVVPWDYSLLTECSHEMVLSAVKKAENMDGIIIRGYNAAEGGIESEFDFYGKDIELHEVKLNEKVVKENIRNKITLKPDIVRSFLIKKRGTDNQCTYYK